MREERINSCRRHHGNFASDVQVVYEADAVLSARQVES